MLASDDVLDVIGEERLRILRQTAVFAAITCPFADSLPEPLVHSGGMTFSQEPTSFGLQNGDEIPNTERIRKAAKQIAAYCRFIDHSPSHW